MLFEVLNDDNFMLYAMKAYENPQCTGVDEFHEDLNRIKYIKRLLRKYKRDGVVRERLILNHIIIFCNVFGIQEGTRILFFRVERDLWSELKTFFVMLKYIPDRMDGDEDFDSISIDEVIADKLRSL
tara:strand:+ start:986 stop:1366 length:381 start_codon:yes stop_codon:yes gene_type:complete